jgi:hypothetical protein
MPRRGRPVAAMSAGRMETVIWVLVYGGLALATVGMWWLGHGVGWPYVLVAVGLVLAAAGVLLIWLRSRRGDSEPRENDR